MSDAERANGLTGGSGTAQRLASVALGRELPDCVVTNGRLVNVYSAEILSDFEIAVSGDRIAWVGRSAARPWSGAPIDELDAQDAYLLPGYFDVHAHADFVANPVALAKAVLPLGTTTILSDSHDICGGLGPLGLYLLLLATEDIPFHYYFTVPPHCPPLPHLEGPDLFPLDRLRDYFGHPRIVSVGEVAAWARLLQGDGELWDKVQAAKAAGLRVEGHTAGCSSEKIQALIHCGITSCHESISPDDVLDRLRLGLATILRHGSIRADLDVVATAITGNPTLDTSRVMLSPDWMSPGDVLARGYMDHLLEEAIRLGVEPVKAIQMVTINPAVYAGVDRDVGGLAPGRLADILFVPDLEHPRPRTVVMGGEIVAREGALCAEFPPFAALPVSQWPPHRRFPRPAQPFNFMLEAGGEMPFSGLRRLPAIHYQSKLITRLLEVEANLEDGFIIEDGVARCLSGPLAGQTVCLLHFSIWSGLHGRWLSVPVSGFGARMGGFALSLAHETHSPIVLGASPADMAHAANRMMELGGGLVVVDDGSVVREVPLACGGVMHTGDIPELAGELRSLNEYLQSRGCPWDDPFFATTFLTFTGLPFVRMTPSGLLDSKTGRILFPQ